MLTISLDVHCALYGLVVLIITAELPCSEVLANHSVSNCDIGPLMCVSAAVTHAAQDFLWSL